ncbi:MAG: DUF2934 domain-containing protein [Phycisphaerae bacterium]
MAFRKKFTPVSAPTKSSYSTAAAPTGTPAPVARSEAKGSGTIAGVRPVAETVKQPTHAQIAERAHQIYLKRGFGPGNAVSDWLEAERQLKAGR